MAKTVAAVIKLIDQFSSPSNDVKKEARDLEKRFGEIGKKIGAVGGVFTSAGSTMTKGITAPLAAIGGASLAAFGEVDAGLDTIVKKTGATGDAMNGFEDVFKNVATSVPADLGDVGAAVGEINTRLGLTGKPLEDATSKFLKFAELNGTDVESSIQTVTRAMGDAGIAAEDYGSILDQMNVAGQVSGISMDALATNLAKYGAPMRALGIDTKTSMAMFAGWEKAGVNTEIAFSGMKKAISNWGKQGKDSTKEFAKTMDAIKKAPDLATATSMAIETFGAKAGPDLADAIKGGRFEVDEYMKALENAGGSVESTFAGTEDGVDKFKTASNAAKIALGDLGAQISTALGPILEKVTEKIKQVSKWFGSLDDSTKQSILKFAAIAMAAGPVVFGIGKVVGTVRKAVEGFGKFAGAVKRAGGIIGALTGPAGIAIAILAGIVAVAILVYKNFDKVKAFAQKMGSKIKSVAKACGIDFGAMKDAFEAVKTKIGTIIDKVGQRFGEIKEKLQPVIDFVEGVFKVGVSAAFDAVKTTITDLVDSAKTIFGGFTDILDGIIMVLDGDFKGGFDKIFGGIRKIIEGAFSGIVGIIKTPLNAVINLVNGAISKINGIKFTVPEWVPGLGGKGWNGLNIPKIPNLYKGTQKWKGGIAAINEPQYGGEIVDLPNGTRVYPHDESIREAREDGSRNISITVAKLADQIIVREEADIDKIAERFVEKIKEVAPQMA